MMVQVSEDNLDYILGLAREKAITPFQIYRKGSPDYTLEEQDAWDALWYANQGIENRDKIIKNQLDKINELENKIKRGKIMNRIKVRLREWVRKWR